MLEEAVKIYIVSGGVFLGRPRRASHPAPANDCLLPSHRRSWKMVPGARGTQR